MWQIQGIFWKIVGFGLLNREYHVSLVIAPKSNRLNSVRRTIVADC